MRPKSLLVLVLACCSLVLLASSCLADVAGAQAGGPIATMMAPAKCGALTAMGIPEPLFMTCTVQLECANGSVKACSGNSCSTGGANNECVVCNGIQQDCCVGTCCQVCQSEREDCFLNCPDGRNCNYCNTAYNICVGNCTGGCS